MFNSSDTIHHSRLRRRWILLREKGVYPSLIPKSLTLLLVTKILLRGKKADGDRLMVEHPVKKF